MHLQCIRVVMEMFKLAVFIQKPFEIHCLSIYYRLKYTKSFSPNSFAGNLSFWSPLTVIALSNM